MLAALNPVADARAETAPRQDVTPVSPEQSTPTLVPTPIGPVIAPVWEVGDEWQYAYKSPSGSGTFVWSINRIESVDEVPHYVIKVATREIFYRVSDLASTLERVDGVVVARNKPSRLAYVWPLAVRRTWEQSYTRERPVDRITENRDIRNTVEGEEQITVPAGTFRTFKVVHRDRNTNALLYEMWYAPDVKQWIKERDFLPSGVRERELLAFKLKQPLSTARPSGTTLTDQLEDAKAAHRRGDYASALRLIRPLAGQGNAAAQLLFGTMYELGNGVPQDYAEAMKWYRRAADQGNAFGQTFLGVMYAGGLGLPQDYAEAAKWYRKAADQGNALGQAYLGILCEHGLGVQQDYAEAMTWYRRAADQGNEKGQLGVGTMYLKSQGVPRDYAEAVKWFRRAADQGNAKAQNNLGGMYATGQGVAQDYVQAHKWFALAASHFSATEAELRAVAVRSRDYVADRMTPAQMAEAQKLVREWRSTK